MVWWVSVHRLRRPAWLPGAVALLTVGFMVSTLIGESLPYPLIPISVADIFHTVSVAVRLGTADRVDSGCVLGSSTPGAAEEGWLVMPAVVLLIVSLFTIELEVLRIRINWFPFGIRVARSAKWRTFC